MGDVGDDFRLMKTMRQTKRANNREQSAELLRQHQIVFTEHNLGAHLIVEGPQGYIDFWPGTGRWADRASRSKGFGVGNLIDHIKQKKD